VVVGSRDDGQVSRTLCLSSTTRVTPPIFVTQLDAQVIHVSNVVGQSANHKAKEWLLCMSRPLISR